MQVVSCGVDMLCWTSPVQYTRREHTAYRDDATLCLVKSASNLVLAAVCIVGRESLLKVYEADAQEALNRARLQAATASDEAREVPADSTDDKKSR